MVRRKARGFLPARCLRTSQEPLGPPMNTLTPAVVGCSIGMRSTLVAPPIEIDQWDLAPFALPPSEVDHITGKIGHTVTVGRPPLFLARDGASGRGALFQKGALRVTLCDIWVCDFTPGRYGGSTVAVQ